MNYEMLKLDNQLCFALYTCSKEITKLYTPHIEELGITYTQYITLMALWERDGITVKELGEILRLGNGTLTPLLKKLEKQGVLKRTRDKEDERNVLIKLTKAGLSMKDKAAEIPGKVICGSNLTADQAIHLREELKQLLSILDNK
jgi:MarR family transcriptional regulator, organic hydroperoxide resistance regulator